MKTQTTIILAAFTFMFVFSAQAQTPTILPVLETVIPSTPAGDATSVDVAGMNTASWERLSKAQSKALVSSDEFIKQQALQNIIYFATYFPEEVNFKHQSMNLYNIYRFDGNENFRIMALAALHAVGDDNAMRILGQTVAREKSSRVRRITNAVLLDYFGPQEEQ